MISEYHEIEYNVGDHVVVLVPETEGERNNHDQFNAGFEPDMFQYDRSIGVINIVGDVLPNGRRSYSIRFEDNETWFWDPFYMRPAFESATLDPDVADFLAEMRKVYKFCVTAEDFESILD